MMNLSSQDSAAEKMLGADIQAPQRGNETMNAKEDGTSGGNAAWLRKAKRAHEQSKTYYETHLRRVWKDSLAHFRSEHAPGSKYHKVDFAKRSRAFRPKTRSMVLRKEAAAAGAFFSMDDSCGISPVDPDNPRGRAAAGVINALVNHRLDVDIPWFLLSMGNYQTALVQGVCASKQYWDYQASWEDVTVVEPVLHPETKEPMLDPTTGEPQVNQSTVKRHAGSLVDKPCIMPIPPENLKFHPNADWLDPVNTSPFLIYEFPMFALDVKKRAAEDDPKTGKPAWKLPTDQQLQNAARKYSETIAVRDNPSERNTQAEQQGGSLKDFDTVWVREYFIREGTVDHTFYTLGDEMMLSDPKPINEVYLHGIRPYQVGIASIEAFKAMPQSKVEQLAPLQRLANEISNQRIDNVRLAMNGRYWVKEGKKIDLAVLQRSTPGSAVLMPDPTTDVKWDRPEDVTASAYQEQDRVNADFDDLGGIFSGSTVQSDNHLNETVGGMKLMSSDAGAVQEYELKIFAVTYIEPVLRQLVKLEQAYETDQALIALAGKTAQTMTKYGIDPALDDLMDEQLLVKVDVGVGATSPDKRVEKLTGAIKAIVELIGPLVPTYGPQVVQSEGVQAIAQEIFGAAGYKDSDRFLRFGQPQPQQGQPGAQGAQPQQGANPEVAAKVLEVEQNESELDRQNKLAVARIKDMGDTTRKTMDGHIKLILAGIEKAAAARDGAPPMAHNLVRFPQQQEPAPAPMGVSA